MTETEWLNENAPDISDWLKFARTTFRHTRRTEFLAAAACVRRLSPLFPDPVCREALDLVEAFADRTVPKRALTAVEKRVRPFMGRWGERLKVIPCLASDAVGWLAAGVRDNDGNLLAFTAAEEVFGYSACLAAETLQENDWYDSFQNVNSSDVYWAGCGRAGRETQRLVRDVYANPFRPATFAAGWRTGTVTALAAGIYADRAFDRLPILADALEEAGCGDADVLAHCRSDGPHVRGCWVVDAVLKKDYIPRASSRSPTEDRDIRVKVVLRARVSSLEAPDAEGVWRATLTTAVKAGANAELVALVAACFGCRKTAVKISDGAGRVKLVQVRAG